MTKNVHAEELKAALVSREWSFTSERMRYVGLLLVSGTAELRIDGGTRSLEGPSYCWVPHGAASTMRLAAGSSGFLVSLDEETCTQICERSGDGLALGQAVRHLAITVADVVRPVLAELIMSYSVVAREIRVQQRGSDASVAAHLELILLLGWRLVGAPEPKRRTAFGRLQTFERFNELVEQHFHEHWSISKFCHTLGVTEDQLHAICNREVGRGPLAILHGRLIETACTRLETSIVPVEQIAIRLGFNDAGYFNRFFKKRVGLSPGAYRRQMFNQRLSERGNAFVAWP